MLVATLSFAVMAAAAKFCAKQGLGAAQIILVRSVIGSAVMAVLLYRDGLSFIGKNPLVLTGRGVIGFVAMYLYFWSIPQINLGTASMLNYTSPVFAVLLASIFLKENLSLTIKAAVAVSFAGMYLLAAPDLAERSPALLAGLLSGFFAAIVHVLIRSSRKDESPFTIILYFTVASTIGSALLLGPAGWVRPSAEAWAALGIVTVTSIIGQLGLTYSLKTAPVAIVSPFGYLTPVFGSALGYVLWEESLTGMGLLGSVLIIASGAFIYARHAREAGQPDE
jgi:drug/metabolite transporter (DMT)-like permease